METIGTRSFEIMQFGGHSDAQIQMYDRDARLMLLNRIAQYQPGQSVSITAFRQGKERTFEVTLGDRSVQFANLYHRLGRLG